MNKNRLFYVRIKSSLRLKMIFLCAAGCLMTFACAIISYAVSEIPLRQQVEEAMQRTVENQFTEIAESVENLKFAQYTMAQDVELIKITTLASRYSTPQINEMLTNLRQKLTLLAHTSPFLYDAEIYIPAVGKRVSYLYGIDALQQEDIIRLSGSYLKNGFLANLNGRPSVLQVFPEPSPADPDAMPDYILAFTLSEEKLAKALASTLPDGGSGAFLLTYSGGQPVFYTSAGQVPVSGDMPAGLGEHMLTGSFFDRGRTKLSLHHENTDWDLFLFGSGTPPLMTGLYTHKNMKPTPNYYNLGAIAGLMVCVLLLNIFLVFTLIRTLIGPLHRLEDAIHQVRKGEYGTELADVGLEELRFLTDGFNRMSKTIERQQSNLITQQKLNQDAVMKQLQYQINPHFLFNSFYMVSRLARMEDNDYLADITQQLGQFYEYVTRNAQDMVTLETELDYVRSYCEIQSARFQNRIRIHLETAAPAYAKMRIPKLTIQPLMENAFEYGASKSAAQGVIALSIDYDRDFIEIHIEDNGPDISDMQICELQESVTQASDNREITALLNIHRRILLSCGEGSGLCFERSSLGGLKATVKLRREWDVPFDAGG